MAGCLPAVWVSAPSLVSVSTMLVCVLYTDCLLSYLAADVCQLAICLSCSVRLSVLCGLDRCMFSLLRCCTSVHGAMLQTVPLQTRSCEVVDIMLLNINHLTRGKKKWTIYLIKCKAETFHM